MSDTFHANDIIGDYEIIRKIGEGAVGEVFLVKHRFLDYVSAMKVIISHEVFINPVVRERFLREARIAAALHHPNVVEVTNVSQIDELDISYIVMEYVEGESLYDYMQSHKTVSFDKVLDVASAIGNAIEAISTHGVIHRDIKPANILMTESGKIKLADLGIAKVTGKGEINDIVTHDVTLDSMLIGTPSYSAPEQCLNANKADVRSDMYSLGMCLYEMLAGKVPFQSEEVMGLIEEVLYKEVPPLRLINPQIPDALNDLVMKMIARDPLRRFQTPAELLTEIRKVRKKLHPGSFDIGKDACRKRLSSAFSSYSRFLLIAGISLVLGSVAVLAVCTTFTTLSSLTGRDSSRKRPENVLREEPSLLMNPIPAEETSSSVPNSLPDDSADINEGGVIFSEDWCILKRYPADRKETSYVIPGYVTIIAPGAFCNCRHLKRVTIPSSVREIGKEAFLNCTSLEQLAIPSSVIRIGHNAFTGCPVEKQLSKYRK